ncbi:hypothetical protein ONZ45_g6643 [Pleurotus djamor]|nr:hypothetical protein ONZ45_g6643 [Pleurotus djamor]
MLSISTTAQPIPVLQAIAPTPPPVYLYLLANALNSLTALATFDLSGMHWGSFTKPQEGDKRVWQSQPMTADSMQADVLIDDDADALDFDDFFAY